MTSPSDDAVIDEMRFPKMLDGRIRGVLRIEGIATAGDLRAFIKEHGPAPLMAHGNFGRAAWRALIEKFPDIRDASRKTVAVLDLRDNPSALNDLDALRESEPGIPSRLQMVLLLIERAARKIESQKGRK